MTGKKVKETCGAIFAIYDFKVKAVINATDELCMIGLHIVWGILVFLVLSHCYIFAIIIICVVSSLHLTIF